MGLLNRLFDRLTESDESRQAEETRAWARTVAGAVPIADVPLRKPSRVAGEVRRITVLPMEGSESVEAVLSDGTAKMTVVFMGRRALPGLNLGTRVVVDGVAGRQRDGSVRMVNPKFEFSTPAP